MINKISLAFILITVILGACKKPAPSNAVDPRITAHYLFKPGTYWVYQDQVTDSMYVTNTGTQNGYPYMQINEVIKSTVGSYPHTHDTIYATYTVYIGAGPTYNQMQIWGYNLNGGNQPQVIFESDTPAGGTLISKGCRFSGIINMSGEIPYGVTGTPVSYIVSFPSSNQNQEYGNVDYFFYPDFGIVQKEVYGTPWGDQWLNLTKAHIIQ